jgi:hypothetical protein
VAIFLISGTLLSKAGSLEKRKVLNPSSSRGFAISLAAE